MKTYKIKEEYWSRWGSEVNENTRTTLEEIKWLANEWWEISVEELLNQVEEVES